MRAETTPHPADSATLAALRAAATRARDYVTLAKPRVALLVLVTVAVGAHAAAAGTPQAPVVLHAVLATALLAAGSSTLNQCLERDTDARMRRTEDRPLPAGRLDLVPAAAFGFTLIAAGTAYLALVAGAVAALLGVVTCVLYVAAYTPLKRVSNLNTLVGAVPGALPPLIGWAAVRGTVDPAAWSLFVIVFLWQFPHFLAIAWLYRDDYARAGIKMLPVADARGAVTGRQMVGYCLALLPASLLPTLAHLAGPLYFLAGVGLGTAYLAPALAFAWRPSNHAARRVLRASLLYLPLLMAVLVLDQPFRF